MRNAELNEAQAVINIAGRSINNLRNEDETTLMIETEEELRNILRKVKEESEKVGLELNIQSLLLGLNKHIQTRWVKVNGTLIK